MQSLLEDLAKDRDKYEHDRASTLDTKIGLLLVFLGLLSGIWWRLIETFPNLRSGILASILLYLLLIALGFFTISVLCLLFAFFGKYRVPARPGQFKSFTEELREYHKKITPSEAEVNERVVNETAQEVFEAVCRSVDQNCATNDRKVDVIRLALTAVFITFVNLVLAIASWLFLRLPH